METATKETTSAGGVVLSSEGKVLVVSQQKGSSWSLPKGHIEEGEDARAAAEREIFEESGVRELAYVKDLGAYSRYKMAKDGGEDRSELKTLVMFLYRTSQPDLKPQDPKNPEARWVEKEKVAELLTHPKDKEFFVRISREL